MGPLTIQIVSSKFVDINVDDEGKRWWFLATNLGVV